METRHKILHLFEGDSDSEDFSDKKRKKKEDLDEDYNMNNYEDDLYSNEEDLYSKEDYYEDNEEEEDHSYLSKNELKRKYSKIKNIFKNYKNQLENKKNTNKNVLRKSFQNSLGRNKNNIQKKYISKSFENRLGRNKNNIEKKFLKNSFENNFGRNEKLFVNNKENSNINNSNINNIIQNVKNNKKSTLSIMKKPKKNEMLKKRKEEQRQLIESQLDKEYFYQNLTPLQWKEISNFISSSLSNKNLKEEDIVHFFSHYPNLFKGEQNIVKLRQILKDLTRNNGFLSFYSKNNFEFESYEKINDFIINNYFMVKPSIFEVHFFPNSYEEIHLINLLSKTRESLDIAMFTINNNRIAEELKNIFIRGVKLRIITYSAFINRPSSNIYSLVNIGVNIKMDKRSRYYMHHKFCVIDKSVIVTGSLNWSNQAVNHNQENLLFLENRNLAMQYSYEFEKLWNSFETVVTKEMASIKIGEDEEKKRAEEISKNREKEKQLMEITNIKKENENEINNEETDNKYNSNIYTNKKRYRNKNDIEQNIHFNNYGFNNDKNINQYNGYNAYNNKYGNNQYNEYSKDYGNKQYNKYNKAYDNKQYNEYNKGNDNKQYNEYNKAYDNKQYNEYNKAYDNNQNNENNKHNITNSKSNKGSYCYIF